MNVLDVEQGSAQWFDARIGMVTASRISDVLAKLKNGAEASTRRSYRMEMVCEILTKRPAEHYVSEWMERGIENEPLARTAYELKTGVTVERVGLVYHPTWNRGAASPDGLVGEDGLIEIKCPKTETHLDYILNGTVPKEYQPQMLWQMACCERAWCDFVSFDPLLPEEFQLFVCRLERNDERIAEIEREAEAFMGEVEATLALLKTRKDGPLSLEDQLQASLAQARLEKVRNA